MIRDFLGDYALQAATAFTATVIAAGYAALAAMITRSVLGSVVAGLMTVFVFELGSFAALALLGMLLGRPELIALYQLTPGYNLGNITSLINEGVPFTFGTQAMTRYAGPNSLGLSIFILAAWVVGLVAVTAALFRRQDITS